MRRTPLDEAIGVPSGAAPVFLDVLGGMSTGQAIENQEKQGQKDACRTQALPIKGTLDKRETWEAMGFVFGSQADDLFVSVTMPDGWELKPTSHSMWSDLLDDKGSKRASMFYKAAFYDMDAFINLSCRFSVQGYDTKDCDPKTLIRVSVYDATKPEAISVTEYDCADGEKQYERREELIEEAREWLTETYPDWRNALAYW